MYACIRVRILDIGIGEEETHSRVANLQDEMLEMCPPRNTKMYVGETVEFKCVGAYYYFAGGFQYVLRRNRSGVITEEVLGKNVQRRDSNVNFNVYKNHLGSKFVKSRIF